MVRCHIKKYILFVDPNILSCVYIEILCARLNISIASFSAEREKKGNQLYLNGYTLLRSCIWIEKWLKSFSVNYLFLSMTNIVFNRRRSRSRSCKAKQRTKYELDNIARKKTFKKTDFLFAFCAVCSPCNLIFVPFQDGCQQGYDSCCFHYSCCLLFHIVGWRQWHGQFNIIIIIKGSGGEQRRRINVAAAVVVYQETFKKATILSIPWRLKFLGI